jgi:choline dehydrogenase-like flavoprotein
MPDIPSANTHIPTIMIAERIASLLVTHCPGVTRAR